MFTGSRATRPKALIVHRYVAPDIPAYGWMLLEIGGAARRAGYDVEIFSTQPSYVRGAATGDLPAREVRSGIVVFRIRLPFWSMGDFGKAVSGAWFSARVFFRALLRKYDVVMAATTPPVVVARAASIAARLRGSVFVYHCQDIHPEIAEGQGLFRWKALIRFFQWMDRKTCESAEQIVVLSSDMQKTLVESRGIAPEKVHVINNFLFGERGEQALAPALERARELLRGERGRFNIVFSGNLGRFQGLEALMDGISLCDFANSIDLIFVGSGSAESILKRRAEQEGPSIQFLGRQPKSVADCLISLADLAVISLRPGLIKYAYPSKTLDYLAAGTPILAIVERESDLAQMIIEHGFGFVATPGQQDGIVRALEAAVATRKSSAVRNDMRALAEIEFGKKAVVQRWQMRFESLIEHRERV